MSTRRQSDAVNKRPIIFSGPMVRAIIDGRKTQTRRVAKALLPGDLHYIHAGSHEEWIEKRTVHCPYGVPGDLLWVRESFRELGSAQMPNGSLSAALAPGCLIYRANGHDYDGPWRPSIHMPRWASRIDLEIVSVDVRRLQEISEEDAKAEGVESRRAGIDCDGSPVKTYRTGFVHVWNSINGKRGFDWAENPWIWAIAFRRVEWRPSGRG